MHRAGIIGQRRHLMAFEYLERRHLLAATPWMQAIYMPGEGIQSVNETASGNIIVASQSHVACVSPGRIVQWSTPMTFQPSHTDVCGDSVWVFGPHDVVRLDMTGRVQAQYGDAFVNGTPLPDNGVVVGGFAWTDDPVNPQFVPSLTYLSADGSVIRTVPVVEGNEWYPGGVIVDSAGDAVITVTGWGDVAGEYGQHAIVAKYDPHGIQLWQHDFGAQTLGLNVVSDSSGDIYVARVGRPDSSGMQKLKLTKLSASGTVLASSVIASGDIGTVGLQAVNDYIAVSFRDIDPTSGYSLTWAGLKVFASGQLCWKAHFASNERATLAANGGVYIASPYGDWPGDTLGQLSNPHPDPRVLEVPSTQFNDSITVSQTGSWFVVQRGNDFLRIPAANIQDADCSLGAGDARFDASATSTPWLVYGGGGNDTIITGRGPDHVMVADGNDLIQTGGGNDTIEAGNGNDTVYCEGGNDQVLGGSGMLVAYGGPGNDTLYGGDQGSILYGGPGNDYLYAMAPLTTLLGGSGNDSISDAYSGPSSGPCVLVGNSGQDTLYAANAADSLVGGGGDDVFHLLYDVRQTAILDYQPGEQVVVGS